MKKLLSLSLAVILCLSITVQAFAANNVQTYNNGVHVFIDENTGEASRCTDKECLHYANSDGVPLEKFPEQESLESDSVGSSPRMYVRDFTEIRNDTYSKNLEAFYINFVGFDNTLGANPVELKYTFSTNTTISGELTVGMEYGGELNSFVAKAQSKISGSITAAASYSRGFQIDTTITISPHDKGGADIYNVGYNCLGTAYYKVLDTSTDKIWTETIGIGALIPEKNSFYGVYRPL